MLRVSKLLLFKTQDLEGFAACPVVALVFVYLSLLFREAEYPVVALVFVFLSFLFRGFKFLKCVWVRADSFKFIMKTAKFVMCRVSSFNFNCERFYNFLMENIIFLVFIYCFFLIDNFLLPRLNFFLFRL